MLTDLWNSPAIRIGVVAVASYSLAAMLLPYPLVAEILNMARLVLAVGVIFAYLPSALDAVRASSLSQGQFLVLGIVLTWSMHVSISIWSTLGRTLNVPTAMVESRITGAIVFGFGISALLHLTAPTVAQTRLSRVSLALIANGLLVGGLVAGFLIALSVIGRIDVAP